MNDNILYVSTKTHLLQDNHLLSGVLKIPFNEDCGLTYNELLDAVKHDMFIYLDATMDSNDNAETPVLNKKICDPLYSLFYNEKENVYEALFLQLANDGSYRGYQVAYGYAAYSLVRFCSTTPNETMKFNNIYIIQELGLNPGG